MNKNELIEISKLNNRHVPISEIATFYKTTDKEIRKALLRYEVSNGQLCSKCQELMHKFKMSENPVCQNCKKVGITSLRIKPL